MPRIGSNAVTVPQGGKILRLPATMGRPLHNLLTAEE